MATLYEIEQSILSIIDTETGEVLDTDKFDQLQLSRNEKIENIALYYKNLLADAQAYKAEKDAFAEKQKRAENKAESLKKYLSAALNGSKFSTARVDVSYRKSSSVEVDEQNLDARFIEGVVTYKIDKSELSKRLKAGEEIRGAKLVEKSNIQIK